MPPSAPLPFSCLEALEPRLAPAGIVAVGVKGGVLTLTGDAAENDNVEIYDAGNGLWGIRDGGETGTTFSLNGSEEVAEVFVNVTRGMKVDLKDGNDILSMDGITINGPVTFKDKSGDDQVSFINTTVNGAVKLNTGAGNDVINARGSTFNETISIQTGTGDDRVLLTRGTYRGITADLGTGANDFELRDFDQGGTINVFGNVSVTSKATAGSSSTFYFGAESFLMIGSLKAKGGLGNGDLMLASTAEGGRFIITGDMTYQGGSSIDSDYISLFGNVTIGGTATFKMGKANTYMDSNGMEQLTLGSLRYIGSSTSNELYLGGDAITVGGDVSFNMGASKEYNFVAFDADALFIGGNLNYKGSKGITDSLSIETTDLQILGTVSYTTRTSLYSEMGITCVTGILGSLVIQGGAGEDQVDIGYETESLNIQGKVTVDLGKTASNQFIMTDTVIHGAASISASTTQPGENWPNQIIDISDSTFLSSLTIKTSGTESSRIALNNSAFLGAVNITTGSANDFVFLDTGDGYGYGNTLAKNLFEGPVRILLGAGDDTLIAGVAEGGEDAGNIFNGTVLFDGGAGLDFNNTASIRGNTYNGTLTEKNFEPQLV